MCESRMPFVKLVGMSVVVFGRQVWALGARIPTFYRRWRQRAELVTAEAERLDRLRHPSKYLGK